MSETQNEQKELELIKFQESADGGAVVELPEDLAPAETEGQEPSKPEVQAKESEDDDDDDDKNDEMADGGEAGADQDAIRTARREKRKARKEYHRQVQAQKNMELEHFKRVAQQLQEKVALLETKTHGSELARLDKAIEDQQTRIAFAKAKIKEAAETGNGELLTQAQEMWFEARRNHEALDALKKKSVSPAREPTIQPPDPAIQRYASDWMSDNPWYDPSGKDSDSQIAMTIDKNLSDGGWDPRTPEYWDELDNRLQKYLPHRYTEQAGEKPVQQRKPRSVVTGSGKEGSTSSGGSGRNTFTLNPEQVRAMKDAGMWDDPEKRNRMIRRYAENARQQRS